MLAALARSKEWSARSLAARSPTTPGECLEQLVKDSNQYVREALASNPSASVALLERMAFDPSKLVSFAVYERPEVSSFRWWIRLAGGRGITKTGYLIGIGVSLLALVSGAVFFL